ncbi:MAG: serine/threonine protein kinase, partial [Acidobacteriota bacterium]
MATKFGRYELLERISAGGMAEVFKASIPGAAGVEKIVAIKRILPQFCDDERFVGMFIEEARISANLNHTNIGQVYEFGEIDGRYYIAMEFIPGKDLATLQEHFAHADRVMPLPMALRIVLDTCAALHHAHSKVDATGQALRIVHRDVSPPNVLVSYEGAVKLIDFGIAKAMARSSKTATGLLKGKYGYLSPEQAEGKEIDHRSDIFSLGTVLHELVSGQRLFVGESDMATLMAVRSEPIPIPSQVNPVLPEGLDHVVMTALERDRERRYQRALDFYVALEGLVNQSRLHFSTVHLGTWMAETFGYGKSAP